MSEAELHILQQRMLTGKLNKAKRGELLFDPPIGYVRRPSGEIALDPDEQVQQVVKIIFRKFLDIGTLNGLLRYLVDQEIQLGVRVRTGSRRGELEWRAPNRMTLQNLLKNPIYAGAYAYGKRQIDPRKKQPGRPSTGRVTTDSQAWHALIHDQFPAYIPWEQHQQNLARLEANRIRAASIGAARHGSALLTGLVLCQTCQCRMTVHYSGRGQSHEYVCTRPRNYGKTVCQQVPGRCLEPFIIQQVLAALQPAALEASLQAAANLEQERTELDQLWQNRLERAAIEAERAGRHYRLVEPENRLVARQLAQEWEDKLSTQQQLTEDYQRFQFQQPRHLSAAERSAIEKLAYDLPDLWEAKTTTPALRKEIIRQLIEKIHIQVQGTSEKVTLSILWTGGTQLNTTIIRPVARWEFLSFYPQLCQRLQQLLQTGYNATEITQQLNQEGFHTPKTVAPLKPAGILDLMRRLGIYQRQPRGIEKETLAPDEWWLPDLSRSLKIPASTLYHWIQRGWLQSRQQSSPPFRLIAWADDTEQQRLKQLHQSSYRDRMRQQWLHKPTGSSPLREE